MRNVFSLFIFLLSLTPLFSGTPTASVTPDDFQYSAGVKGPIKNNSLYQIILSDEILQRCSADCKDLRLTDPANNEIPHVIIKNKTQKKTEKYLFEIIQYEEDSNLAVITMKLPEKHKPISIINLITTDRDFKKNLILHGSHDMGKWILLAEDNIYDFSSQVDLRKTKIKFRRSDYNYYRLQLIEKKITGNDYEAFSLKYKGMDFSVNNIKNKNIRINKIMAQATSEKKKAAVNDEAVFTEFYRYTEEDGDTAIIVEAGLPFNRVSFDASNPYFYRVVEIYYSDTGKEDSYRLLKRAPIYRFHLSGHKEARNYIEYAADRHKFYKLLIKNKNNPPLILKKIKFNWVQRNLYFIGLNDASAYTLRFGNPALDRPDYDLARFIHQGNWFSHNYEKLETTQVKKNINYKPVFSRDRQTRIEKMVLTVIIVIMVVGIGFWLYTLVRKISNHTKK